MKQKKTSSIIKISACVGAFLTFVAIAFVLSASNIILPSILTVAIGSVVVVTSYYEYQYTLSLRSIGKKKKKKLAQVQQTTTEATKDSADAEDAVDDGIPEMEMTLFPPEILQKVDSLKVQDEIKDEILSELKDIPPEERMAFIKETFERDLEFEESY
ncbi:MAG: hypothetical protein ACFFCS_23855 [Candidatus Hodarchaeota archaeon]